MDDRQHHLTRELERKIEQVNRRMEEQEREMERRIEAMRRQFEEPIPSPEQPGWLPEGGEPGGGPMPDFQDQQPELGPIDPADSGLPSDPGKMNIDLIDQEEEYVLTADVPGFSEEEIEVSLTNDVLHIEATREESEEGEDEEQEEEEKRYVQRERQRSMSRSVPLGGPIAEEEETSANYENGVLTIRLPKAEPTEDESVRQIDIE